MRLVYFGYRCRESEEWNVTRIGSVKCYASVYDYDTCCDYGVVNIVSRYNGFETERLIYERYSYI